MTPTTTRSAPATATLAAPAALSAKPQPQWRRNLQRLLRHRSAMLGLGMIVAIGLLALLAPVVAPYDPADVGVGPSLAPPSREFLMGTDTFGRDVFSRVVWGAQLSLQVGAVAVVISAVVGILIGLISGYYGGWIDGLLMRVMDILLAFPGLLLALAVVAVLGISLQNLMIAVGIGGIPSFARLVRGSVLSVRENLYVTVARSLGARDGLIMGRHILPNIVSPVLVYATLRIAFANIAAASLSYLGLGVQPPTASWGNMLQGSLDYVTRAPWLVAAPGVMIFLTVLSIFLLADGLRDAFDPRMKG